MKRQALDHTKMDLLMRRLNLPRYAAVGIMESLWHLTAKEAPRGDIGKLSNERIAIGIGWRGAANRGASQEADKLVCALVEARWIDVDDQWRLVIHDWPEHADDSVKKYIKRNELTWAVSRHVATSRDMERLPVPLPVPEPLPAPAPAPVGKPGTPVFASGGLDAGQTQPQNPLSEESSTEPQPSPLPPIPAAPPEAVELDDLDLDSPIETFFRNAVGRERRLKWNPSTRDGERDVERLHADDSPQFRAALLQWLADDAVKWKEIKSPVAYFRSCWESYDLAPTKNGKNGANGNGSSRTAASREAADAPVPVPAPAPPVSTPQRSQEPLLPKYAQIWNAKMTDPEVHVKHWGKYAPRAELAEAEREPEFTEGFDKICAGCLDLMRPGGKITGVTFEWLFKICKGRPNWYQVLTGFYSWGAAPKAWAPPALIDPYAGMTEEQIAARKAAEEKAAIENERRFTRNSKGEIIAERYGSDPEYEARIRGRKCKAEREAREAAELAARRAEVEAKTAEFVGAGK